MMSVPWHRVPSNPMFPCRGDEPGVTLATYEYMQGPWRTDIIEPRFSTNAGDAALDSNALTFPLRFRYDHKESETHK